ncbi:RsmB/NOP family class I SAM-dependent RNA methyltransferase [Nocardioides sp.]|uniref:RsmB/NOP family class I SAM-dependent RNA methyltransferase n=1 Tax=Nocardioides sp. TaxID=35761 RepID=UPI003D1135A0
MADPRARNRRPGGRPPARRAGPASDPSRSAAYDVLKAVRLDDAYTNLVLPHVLREHELTGRDAAFTTELVSGTIRRQGTYDAIIMACLDRPKVEAKVLDALRLGAHQLLSMRVPAHAAISTTVDLVRAKVGQGPAGFTNAVLRKVAAHDLAGWIRRVAPDPAQDPIGFASLAHSHPRWVVGGLRDALGPDGDLDALLAADNLPPKVMLVARPGLCTPQELLALGGTPGQWSPYAVQLEAGDPGVIPAVTDDRAGVQDEGSQLVALALARAPMAGRDERWLDLCAGPGGKSALLAALARERGAKVLASELQHHRAGLVARGTRQLSGGLLGVITADGTRPPWRPGSFDRILLDAPCSGLGALRRRPESRWRRTPGDVKDLVSLQHSLLSTALDSVRHGGVVAYVTCSPLLAETAEIVTSVLEERRDVELLDAGSALEAGTGLPVPDSDGPLPGTVQLWPHVHGTDAMFLALLTRR